MAEETEKIYEREGAYESFYSGSYTPFEREFGEYFTGYRVPTARIGAPTSPMTADQIRQASRLLNTGMKIVEAGAIDPRVFEAIPKQHFAELKRIAELADAEITVHGPILELSGIGEGGWREEERRRAERLMYNVIEKAKEVSPEGNVPVTFHAGAVPIQRWRYLDKKEREELLERYPQTKEIHPELYKEIQQGKVRDYMLLVDQETGQMQPVKWDEKIWPEGKVIFDPKERAEMLNRTTWEGEKFELGVLEEQKVRLASLIPAEAYGRLKEEERILRERFQRGVTTEEDRRNAENVFGQISAMESNLREANFRAYSLLRDMYNDFNKYAFKEDVQSEKRLREEFQETLQKNVGDEIQNARRGIYSDRLIQGIRQTLEEYENKLAEDRYNRKEYPRAYPEKWKPADEFAADKVAETTANAAFQAWKKFGNKAPVIALENFPDTVMSTGDEAKNIITKARDKFVEQAKKAGKSETDARFAAERLIGLTWDLGHLNMMRKYGFPEEFVSEETAKIAQLIKKTHLTDNFGFEDAHLPPGMGNVPFKKALAELEKKGVKVPQIVEAAGFFQHFKTNPHPYVLEGLGSPLYTYMMEPYWNQARLTYGAYFQGYGEFLPDFHFRTYGSSSFSALPFELGGELPGEARQRFGAQAME